MHQLLMYLSSKFPIAYKLTAFMKFIREDLKKFDAHIHIYRNWGDYHKCNI